MTLPVKVESRDVLTPQSARILRLPSPGSTMHLRVISYTGAIAARAIPPLVVVVIALGVWEMLCSAPSASLPSPTRIWAEAGELILNPFFAHGPQDLGLGWRLLVSLQ